MLVLFMNIAGQFSNLFIYFNYINNYNNNIFLTIIYYTFFDYLVQLVYNIAALPNSYVYVRGAILINFLKYLSGIKH